LPIPTRKIQIIAPIIRIMHFPTITCVLITVIACGHTLSIHNDTHGNASPKSNNLNQPCSSNNNPNDPNDKYDCLPNAELLNAGIDLSTGDPMKGQVLDLSWCNNSFYRNPNNGKYYMIPCNITVNTLSKSSDTEGTFLFSDTVTIEKWQASQVTQSYVGGMFSHSTMTEQSMTSQYSQMRDTGYVIKKMAVYNTIIPPSEQVLGPVCQKNVDMLPLDYNQDMYFEFIFTYGTHYADQSIWGIEYTFLSNYKACIKYTHSESYMYDQTTTSAWVASDHHTTYSGQEYTDEYYQSRTITSETFSGGDMNCHSSDRWDCWVASGYNMQNPVRISYSTKPIYTLIKDEVKQANMMRAFNEYFQMKQDKQNETIEQAKYGPHTIAYASFDATCDIYGTCITQRVIPSSTVQLAAGDIMQPVGINQCNFFRKTSMDRPHGSTLYFYQLYMFQCSRHLDGSVSALNYFDENIWLNTIVAKSNECANIWLNKTDYFGDYAKSKFYWTPSGTNYVGAKYTYPSPPKWPLSTYYSVDYYDATNQADVGRMSEDGYPTSEYSQTSSTTSGFVCFPDCDYITATYDVSTVSFNYQCTC